MTPEMLRMLLQQSPPLTLIPAMVDRDTGQIRLLDTERVETAVQIQGQ